MEITFSKPSTDEHGFLSIIPPLWYSCNFQGPSWFFLRGNLPSLKSRYPLNFETWWKLEVESWRAYLLRGLPSLKLTEVAVRLKMVVSKFGISKLQGSLHFQGWILRWLRCMYRVGCQHYWSPGPYGVLDRGRCWTVRESTQNALNFCWFQVLHICWI